MITRTALLLLALICTGGCSSVRLVDAGSGGEATRQFNQDVEGKVARVTFVDGRETHVVGARVEGTRFTWVDRERNVVESVPIHLIAEVDFVRAGAGALRGLLVGAVVGAAAGGVRAALEGDDPIDDPFGATQDEKYRIYPVAHAVYASLVTTPIGAIVGTRRIYRFAGSMPVVDR